jgi:hypothetical protein
VDTVNYSDILSIVNGFVYPNYKIDRDELTTKLSFNSKISYGNYANKLYNSFTLLIKCFVSSVLGIGQNTYTFNQILFMSGKGKIELMK